MASEAFDASTQVHFVGVGGVRMSALAEMLTKLGCRVSGSDREASIFTDHLQEAGITVRIGHAAEHVGNADVVVFTPAVDPENAELAEARQRGIQILEGKRLLGRISKGKRLIAVSGTHGKTTTTAMVTQICETAGLDPTSFVGGAVQDRSNLRIGSGDVWVVEADEYDRAFLELTPSVTVVTSLEADHLDMYESEQEIVDTFDQFLGMLPEHGSAVICEDYRAARKLEVPEHAARISYGRDADLTAISVKQEGFSTSFKVSNGGSVLGEVTIQLPGRHNVANALGAVGAASAIDVPFDSIRDGLARFKGVKRRFEVVGSRHGVTIINDYAHHPTEIEQTIAAARSVWDGRVVAVFQPHLYSRTRDFASSFAEVLSAADIVWLTDIYPAREAPIEGITAMTIADGIQGCRYEGDLKKLAVTVGATIEPGDMILVMGAGSIERVARELADKLSAGALGTDPR